MLFPQRTQHQFYNQHGGSKPSITPTPGHLMPSSGLHGHQAHMWNTYIHIYICTYIHADKAPIHIKLGGNLTVPATCSPPLLPPFSQHRLRSPGWSLMFEHPPASASRVQGLGVQKVQPEHMLSKQSLNRQILLDTSNRVLTAGISAPPPPCKRNTWRSYPFIVAFCLFSR